MNSLLVVDTFRIGVYTEMANPPLRLSDGEGERMCQCCALRERAPTTWAIQNRGRS